MKPKYIFSFVILVLSVALGVKIYTVWAVSYKDINGNTKLIRARVTFTDVKNGTNVDGDPARKKVKVRTLNANDGVAAIVHNVDKVFELPSGAPVYVESIRAEQAGVEVSGGDLSLPPDLSYIHFENRLGSTLEYGFYSETVTTDIYYTIGSSDGSSLDGLTVGQLDAYLLISL